MKWMSAPLLALAACLPLSAKADGNFLLSQCQLGLKVLDGTMRNDDMPNALKSMKALGHCLGVIQGTIDTSALMERLYDTPHMICLPEGGIQKSRGVKVVLEYLESRPPDKLLIDESGLIYGALLMEYPCE